MSMGESRRNFFQRAGAGAAAWMAARSFVGESEAQESGSEASFGDNAPSENLAAKGERRFQPMTKDEKDAFRARCATYAGDGRFELYKSSMRFEGPPGREQHGFPPPKKMEG